MVLIASGGERHSRGVVVVDNFCMVPCGMVISPVVLGIVCLESKTVLGLEPVLPVV